MVNIGGNVENSGRDSYRFLNRNNGKAGSEEDEQNVVYSRGGGGTRSGRNSVR